MWIPAVDSEYRNSLVHSEKWLKISRKQTAKGKPKRALLRILDIRSKAEYVAHRVEEERNVTELGGAGASGPLVGIIEDHPLYRTALVQVLESAVDIRLGMVADSVARFAAGGQSPGGVVILDLKLRGVRDAAAVLEIVGMGHRVLVVSAHAGQDEVLGAIAAGARGYLSKDADGSEILRGVREIAAGNSYVSPMLAALVLDSEQHSPIGPRIVLSDRERQVLSLVAAGERDADIAESMSISIRTVRSYLDRIRDKTGRRRRPELTRLAIEEGIAHSVF